MNLRIIETPHKSAPKAFAVVCIDDDDEHTVAWADTRDKANVIMDVVTLIKQLRNNEKVYNNS